jgi:hypothetical protein
MSVNFDRVARAYRWLEYLSFGPWLARCRHAQLPHLAGARHALILGDGDGRLLVRLLSSSQLMLNELERRLRRLGPQTQTRVQLHHADALSWNVTGHYDLIVTHFFLDCFFTNEVALLTDRILAHASPDAQWVISEFAIPQNFLLRPAARALVTSLYRAFGLLTGLEVRALPDYESALCSRGLILSQERRFLAGVLRSQLWVRGTSPKNTPP